MKAETHDNGNMKQSIVREGNTILVYELHHPRCVSQFIWIMKEIDREGYQEVKIKWLGEKVFPNACVPISGIIQYYKTVRKIKFCFEISPDNYLFQCGFAEPIYEEKEALEKERNPFDKIYRYNEYGQVAALTQAYINAISRQQTCSKGVIDSLIWCINEVMDNVLLHGETDNGYVMAQFHEKTKHVAFCVFDAGVGIYNTLKESTHSPKKPIDALSLSIQEGVGDGKGQGNGLYGLYQIICENKGLLTITSGSASMMFSKDGNIKKFERIPFLSPQNNETIIDFQLDLMNEVNIQNAFKTIGGFDGFDIRLDDMWQEDNTVLYNVYENCRGTATREAGFELRNDVQNTLSRMKAPMILDFSEVQTVSSSFIDEFISKLVVSLGMIEFNELIRVKNMNETVRFLCNRSTYMRIHEEWKKLQ